MITHYFKIAFRNLLKYKSQSAISIIGLAVGFVCFALSSLWIHYEMTYDSTYEGADRMYILYRKDILNNSGYSTGSSYPMSTLLKKEFPEVEAACAFNRWPDADISANGQSPLKAPILIADSCFMDMFGISVLAGNMDFMYADDKTALPEDMAIRLFGTTNVLGKKVKYNDKERTVCAILNGVGTHSNLSFGFWGEGAYFRRWLDDWTNGAYTTIIKLHEGVSPQAFQLKMEEFSEKPADTPNTPAQLSGRSSLKHYSLMPLSEYHYAAFNQEKSIEFNYLVLFSVAGILVILCSLFNYLSLFVTRLYMRGREIELRKICGSSIRSLFAMFTTEYLLIILISGFLGMTLLELILPAFKSISYVSGNVYGESVLYFAAIMLLSMLLLLPFVKYNPNGLRKGKKYLFRKVSVVFQLAIGILFIFCMGVIMKQVYHLTNTDLGWERKNIAAFKFMYPVDKTQEIGDKIEQWSCVKELLRNSVGLLPKGAAMSLMIDSWEGKEESDQEFTIEYIGEGKSFADFYQLKLLKGEMIKDDDKDKIVINETAAKMMGMNDPIGKRIHSKREENAIIVGLMKDFHTTSPTTPVNPTALAGSEKSFGGQYLQMKYHEGKWKELNAKIDSLFAKEYPEVKFQFVNVEDVYADYLKSEHTLLKMLSFIALICALISVFGIFSLVTLTCEQRQREIAVRKVNGARIKDILLMFAKEYSILLTIASLIAFPIGYVVMRRWLESYVEQTEINSWFFASIYGGIAILISLCIGWRVWRTATINPAETIKTE